MYPPLDCDSPAIAPPGCVLSTYLPMLFIASLSSRDKCLNVQARQTSQSSHRNLSPEKVCEGSGIMSYRLHGHGMAEDYACDMQINPILLTKAQPNEREGPVRLITTRFAPSPKHAASIPAVTDKKAQKTADVEAQDYGYME